ncbi:pyruvate decarboxylase, partial [Staphylococcus aureus]|uniref:thiamine pyrophosphate-dependent enzyme n=1 Tax=Staphylococcus aureus TaxID=1280 RepID=UPI00065BB088
NNATFTAHYRPTSSDYTDGTETLTQHSYFKMIQNFLKSNDVIIADQGTSFFGAYDLALYNNNTFMGQPFWGSIGYTLPSTLGSQLADKDRRNLLLIGDGSLQLTVQAISTMIRQHIKPVLFVINNDGYT